jgi:hypothetical protein
VCEPAAGGQGAAADAKGDFHHVANRQGAWLVWGGSLSWNQRAKVPTKPKP